MTEPAGVCEVCLCSYKPGDDWVPSLLGDTWAHSVCIGDDIPTPMPPAEPGRFTK